MIKLSTYHAHTSFCDGKSTAEEMILAAIERGCPQIGLSGHSPLHGQEWTMTDDSIISYFETLASLREKYRGVIDVFIGIEQDLESDISGLPFDYVIGSVHAITVNGKRIDVDHSKEITRDAINKHFGGDPYSYCEAFYENAAKIYGETHCDIIGHFDLVTKFIEVDPLFSIEHPRYIKARDAALESLLRTPAVFEVNTGAISRGYRSTPYPDSSVLNRLRDEGRPVVVTSDSHSADTVDFLIDETADGLRKRGIKCLSTMEEILALTRKK